ncbi:hypothetical protein DICPUDRAFT_74432 [Dictyostelium purpureum]|uniref:Uncharacterized protein n=1 Tax=Dictyostelium purpureum TaxID=5786 RepID=F0Z7Q6_DICPU|nr:uncharacterized protein DICPUDRAFT_74432 [Dictyostelium purpureum]EGC40058.1 hypothetical protein DICPUDRAFT_74432 [Dictyostelium purpureum]|eukprot:XP_003283407.1 hypothetical protein DICPUDRAFT_74432 [Dictyostelium purpureum]
MNNNNSNKEEEKYYKENEKEFQKALERAVPIGKGLKHLLTHERELMESGELKNITHKGSSSVWLEASSSIAPPGMVNVYRPMGDIEVQYLVENKLLPDTQPYQAIIEGSCGRAYANKYLTGKKWTDTNPSTVVEFTCPIDLIEKIKSIQTKIEDGAISMGLGNKAGNTLHYFNDSLRDSKSTFRIVKVKRQIPQK